MPLTLDDIEPIVKTIESLVSEIRESIRKDGPGGRKLTRAEIIRILGRVGQLLVVLTREIED